MQVRQQAVTAIMLPCLFHTARPFMHAITVRSPSSVIRLHCRRPSRQKNVTYSTLLYPPWLFARFCAPFSWTPIRQRLARIPRAHNSAWARTGCSDKDTVELRSRDYQSPRTQARRQVVSEARHQHVRATRTNATVVSNPRSLAKAFSRVCPARPPHEARAPNHARSRMVGACGHRGTLDLTGGDTTVTCTIRQLQLSCKYKTERLATVRQA
jgi:hypothetical protein